MFLKSKSPVNVTDEEWFLILEKKVSSLEVCHFPCMCMWSRDGKDAHFLLWNVYYFGLNLTIFPVVAWISHAADDTVYQFCDSTFEVCEIKKTSDNWVLPIICCPPVQHVISAWWMSLFSAAQPEFPEPQHVFLQRCVLSESQRVGVHQQPTHILHCRIVAEHAGNARCQWGQAPHFSSAVVQKLTRFVQVLWRLWSIVVFTVTTYYKTLIIRVTLFSRGQQPRCIHETLFLRFVIYSSIILA